MGISNIRADSSSLFYEPPNVPQVEGRLRSLIRRINTKVKQRFGSQELLATGTLRGVSSKSVSIKGLSKELVRRIQERTGLSFKKDKNAKGELRSVMAQALQKQKELKEGKIYTGYQKIPLKEGKPLHLEYVVSQDAIYFDFLEDLGAGAMKKITRGLKLEFNFGEPDWNPVAVIYAEEKEDVAAIGTEMEALRLLEHPHIQKGAECIAKRSAGGTFYILPFYEGGDAERYLDGKGMTEEELLEKVMQPTAKGLAHIHKSGMTHRDVKPANLLIDGEGKASVGDLGTLRETGALVDDMKKVKEGRTSRSFTGTPSYIDPAVLFGGAEAPEGDTFAWGVSMLQLLEGEEEPLHTTTKFTKPPLPIPLLLQVKLVDRGEAVLACISHWERARAQAATTEAAQKVHTAIAKSIAPQRSERWTMPEVVEYLSGASQ